MSQTCCFVSTSVPIVTSRTGWGNTVLPKTGSCVNVTNLFSVSVSLGWKMQFTGKRFLRSVFHEHVRASTCIRNVFPISAFLLSMVLVTRGLRYHSQLRSGSRWVSSASVRSEVSSSLTSSQHVAILSFHITTKRGSPAQSDILRERYHLHITFIIVYYYNRLILLFLTVNLLLSLIYKLNFIVGTYVEDRARYRTRSVLSLAVGLHWGSWNVSPVGRRDYCTWMNIHIWSMPILKTWQIYRIIV